MNQKVENPSSKLRIESERLSHLQCLFIYIQGVRSVNLMVWLNSEKISISTSFVHIRGVGRMSSLDKSWEFSIFKQGPKAESLFFSKKFEILQFSQIHLKCKSSFCGTFFCTLLSFSKKKSIFCKYIDFFWIYCKLWGSRSKNQCFRCDFSKCSYFA